MSGQQRQHRRRVVYIHRAFQRKFIIQFCVIALCAMIAASLLVYFFSKNTLTATYRYHHLALQRTGEAILPALVITNLVILLALLAATIAVTLYVSHKIAGPLYRLGRSLENIGSGDLTFSVQLREHDELSEIAQTLNNTIENLRSRVSQIQEEIHGLKEKTLSTGWSAEEIQRDIDSLHQKTHYLFKTAK
jgi:methyl-accepting chemotaxis protein